MEKAGLKTEIVTFDHNCDHPQYPITVLSDPAAGKYTGGSGFHLYLGDITALTTVHDAFPNKDIFSLGRWWSHVPERLISGSQSPLLAS